MIRFALLFTFYTHLFSCSGSSATPVAIGSIPSQQLVVPQDFSSLSTMLHKADQCLILGNTATRLYFTKVASDKILFEGDTFTGTVCDTGNVQRTFRQTFKIITFTLNEDPTFNTFTLKQIDYELMLLDGTEVTLWNNLSYLIKEGPWLFGEYKSVAGDGPYLEKGDTITSKFKYINGVVYFGANSFN